MYLNHSSNDLSNSYPTLVKRIQDHTERRQEGPNNADDKPSCESFGSGYCVREEKRKWDWDNQDKKLDAKESF